MRVFIRIGLLLSALLISGFSLAGVIEVCETCEVKTIKEAVAKAEEGDQICVFKGVYKEMDILIEKPLTLEGETGAIIDGENKGEIIQVGADNVTIDGFEIINVGSSPLKDFAAVRIIKSNEFIVQNLVINKPFFGIYLEKASNGYVKNNKIYGDAVIEFTSGNGIHMWHSNDNIIENNLIDNERDGIYLEHSHRNRIRHNKSMENVRYGLHFMFCHENKVYNNEFQHNGAGIAIMFSKKMEMYNNYIHDNWGGTAYGVLLKEVVDTKIINNVFERNTTGANVEGSNRIDYQYNEFRSNGWAINSRGGNYKNVFTKNNFMNNSFDLSYGGGMNSNSFNGNYWSEYTGYDLDKDGVGDVPYRPVKLFSYLVNKSPEAIILLRSMFIDIVDFSEKVSPVFTPDDLMDEAPSMKRLVYENDYDRN